MYLIDSNIILEALLDQEKAHDVRLFLDNINLSECYITDLALHSIGIRLFREEKRHDFSLLLKDVIIDGLRVVYLSPNDLKNMEMIAIKYSLDFDEAYQYLAAKLKNLQIVSFDKHFDRTEIGRKEPGEIIRVDD